MAKKTEVTKPLKENPPRTFKPIPPASPTKAGKDVRRDGPALIDALASLKGMNRDLAERIASEWREGENDIEVAARFGLDVLDAAEVIKIMEVSKW